MTKGLKLELTRLSLTTLLLTWSTLTEAESQRASRNSCIVVYLLLALPKSSPCTFSILVYGNKIKLHKTNLTARGRYDYQRLHDAHLATTPDDYAFINETVEIVYLVVRLVEDSIPTNKDEAHNLNLPDYASFIKPTVYTTNIEDSDDDEST